MYRTRFAPSPTGRLHLGHALAAITAHDLARENGGEFLLRFEDIDSVRSRKEYYTAIEDDLHWLGLAWNGPPLCQSSRPGDYAFALSTLRNAGVVYPCFCTRKDMLDEAARMTNAPHGPEGALYPGKCRALSQAARKAKLDAGTPFSWRLDSAAAARITGPLTFRDLNRGIIPVDADLLGDVVLARKDIGISYHLAVVADDAFQGISHVTRGEDLLASTHVHRILQCLLGLPEPAYLHHPLVLDETGKRLAKRHDALSLAGLRERGCSPREVREMALAWRFRAPG